MIEFSCIGYDIRNRLTNFLATADATSWPQKKDLYSNVKDKNGIEENYFQLLNPKNKNEFESLKNLVLADNEATLISIEIPVDLISVYQKNQLIVSETYFSNEVEWVEYGYDVCDVNGFFSILHMNVLEISQIELFQSNALLDAYLLSNKANILVPDHSPFTVVKLKIYKN